MHKLALLLLVFLPQLLWAQPEKFDTIFHPIYEGKQLIELKSNKDNFHLKGFNETELNLARNPFLSKYAVINEKKEICEVYNDFDGSLTRYLQAHKKEIDPIKALKFHKLKTENSAHTVGYDNGGYNVLYPVYQFKKSIDKPGKVGLMDSLGKFVFPVEFDRIQWVDSVFITQKEGKFQLYNYDFKLLLSGYDTIEYISTYKDHILLKKEGKYGLIHRDGRYILPEEYDLIRNSKFRYMHYEFRKNGLWGFVDVELTRFLPPFSPSCSLLEADGFFQYQDSAKQWHILNSNGEELLVSPMQMTQVISDNAFCVYTYDREKGYLRSLVNAKGAIISSRVYYDLWRVNDQTLLAGYDAKILDASELKKSSKWQLIYPNGEAKNDQIYTNIQIIDSNFLKVYDPKGKVTVIDDQGKDVLGYTVDDIYKYDTHLFKIVLDGKHQFIDLHNPSYYSARFDNLQCVREHRIAVTMNQKWGFIDESFREIFPIIADRVTCFQDGVATVVVNGKTSIIDLQGKYVTAMNFDVSTPLAEGYTQVRKDGKYGIINKAGKFTVPLVYDEIKFVVQHNSYFYVGVKQVGKYGIITINNQLIYPIVFDNCGEISVYASIEQKRSDGFYAFLDQVHRTVNERIYANFDPEKNQLQRTENYSKGFQIVKEPCNLNVNKVCYGVKNWDGQYVIPCRYMYISEFKNNTFRIADTTGGGLVDTLGNILIPMHYKYLYDLAGKDQLIQVGHHQGDWGLFNYQGKRIADTLYGGFERPEFGLIPFYKSFNYHFDANHKWVHNEEKKIGLMDMNGKILIEPIYDRYTVPDQRKKEIQFVNEENIIWVNEKGEIIKSDTRLHYSSEISKPEIPQVPPSKKGKKKRKARWL